MEGLENEEDNQKGMGDPAEVLMQRGEYLRQLRQLEQDDERQRNEEPVHENNQFADQVDVLPDSERRVLRYESYLLHQSFYDDLKHVDYEYVDFGSNLYEDSHTTARQLIIEQDKSLGKGGLCWDAAFILAEFLISNQNQWAKAECKRGSNLIELGSGTGLCGLMVANGVPDAQVYLTDLPELQYLLRRNAKRNFSNVQSTSSAQLDDDDTFVELSKQDEDVLRHGRHPSLNEATGTSVCVGVLRWGDGQDMKNYPPADVVIGADVVASLYDPVALAQTIHALCRDSNSLVSISYKERLSGPHQVFDEELGRLFEQVEHIIPKTRNKNPLVRIIRATGKRIDSNVNKS